MQDAHADTPAGWADLMAAVERGQWTAMLVDATWHLQWVSPELQSFLGESDPQRLGYGLPMMEAWLLPAWTTVTDAESLQRLVSEIAPFMLGDLAARGLTLTDAVRADLLPLFDGLDPQVPPPVWNTSFGYLNPDGVEELGGYNVKALTVRLGGTGEDDPLLVLFDIDAPPRLVSLLARGNSTMYERMARLVTPGRHAAAILFCDLQGSGVLSRKLPTAEYFRLVRQLWSAIDGAVGDNRGVVGKHAGDGASAFFLAEDLGSASAAARAAITTARTIHAVSAEVFRDVADLDCLMKVGLHWGDGLYMGQLVPGGRLDVTALGDEVNEAARIEQAAGAHETLASKQLIERLASQDAAALGLSDSQVAYRLLSEIAAADSKIVRDAGNLAVTAV